MVINKVVFDERYITGPVEANSEIEVQEYTVGANALDVYLNGCRSNVNSFYEEVGTVGEKSNKLKILDAFSGDYTICVRSTDIVMKEWANFNNAEAVVTAINCSELVLNNTIKAGSMISVPDYVVGNFELEMFVDGVKAERGIFYEEIGLNGSYADLVKIIDDVSSDHEITFRITSMDSTNAGDFEGEHQSSYINTPFVTDLIISETEYTSPIENGFIIDVGEYYVGHNEIDLYAGGLKLEPNRDWREIGAIDEVGHLIQMGVELTDKELVVRKMHPVIYNIKEETEEIINEVTFIEKVLNVPIDQNTMVRTRPYIVGEGRIEVFKNGVKLRANVDFFEIGDTGESGTHISFAKKVYEDDVVEVRTLTIKKEKFADSWAGYSSWTKKHQVIETPIDESDIVTINQYVVESGMLDVYINGYKAFKTDTYSEIGAKGAISSQIQFLTDIFPNATVCDVTYDCGRVTLGNYRPKAEMSKTPFINKMLESEITLTGPITANTNVNIPEFTAAHNEVQVFVNGEKINQPESWKENGYRGTLSNSIFFTEDIATDAIVNIRVIHPDKKYITWTDDVINQIEINEVYRNGPIAAMENITVPVYTVGANAVVIHKNGEKLLKGTDFYEVGTIDARSSKIKFAEEVKGTDELIIRVTQPETLAYDELIEEDTPLNNIVIYDSFSHNLAIPVQYELIVKPYMVGSHTLEVYVDGIKCRRGEDYVEMGKAGDYSNQIRFLYPIAKTQELNFRIINFLNNSFKNTNTVDPTDIELVGPFLGHVRTNVHNMPYDSIYADDYMTVAEYIVGTDTVDVYIDGVKAILGETFIEVGDVGEKSTQIQWKIDLETNRTIVIVHTAPDLLDNADYTTIVTRKVTMTEQEINVPITANDYIEVPAYLVGSNDLRVFMSGVLLDKGVFYEEVGKDNELSTTIKFNVDVHNEYKIFVKSTTFVVGQLGTSTELLTNYGWDVKLFEAGKYEESSILEVPEYVVGTATLELFIDGLKVQNGYTYEELGEPDMLSTQVLLKQCVLPKHGIEARALVTDGKIVSNILVGW